MASADSLAVRLAERISSLQVSDIPAAALRAAAISITDTVGVTVGGATSDAVKLASDALALERTEGAALVFGTARRAAPLEAAFINGVASHALDYDDMALALGGHPSVMLVPGLLALAETLDANGMQVMDAYIAGFEAACRIGRALHPFHYERGWHPTSTVGIFGTAVGAARLLRLDVPRMATAIAISASLASGVKANFGTMTKPLHVGHAVRSGLLAARLAQAGFTANLAALEEPQGYFAAFNGLDHVDQQGVLAGPERGLELEQEAFGLKQFPCCGSTHPAVLSMLQLRARGVDPARVRSIEIRAHPRRLPHTDKPLPDSPLAAKFSIQYATVRALLDGPPRLEHFEGAAFAEPRVRELLARTRAIADAPAVDAGALAAEHEMACEVVITLEGGERLAARASPQFGRGASHPMSEEELWTKYSDCTSGLLAPAPSRASFEALRNIDQCRRISDITRLLEAGGA